MANLSKLKGLGTPPAKEEASPNLAAPEVAPLAPESVRTSKRRDGRSAKRTHRTLPFATRVSPEFDNGLRDIADRDGLLLVEVLERALDAYEEQQKACS
jgi:hypothetical protein